MIMTLREVLVTCSDWLQFCAMKNIDEYAVNEGGGEVQVELTVHEAHQLGIVKLTDKSST